MSAEEFRLNLRVLWFYVLLIATLSVIFIKGPLMLEHTFRMASHVVNFIL